MERAIKERVLLMETSEGWKPPFRPAYKDYKQLVKPFTKVFREKSMFTKPMGRQEFANHYTSRKLTRYLRAAEKLDQQGWHDDYASIKAFLKVEKYNFTAKHNPCPRMILPPGDEYIVECGRYIKPIEKLVYKAIDICFGSPTVMKQYNAVDRGNIMKMKWDKFVDPIAIPLDVSRFDRHVSNAALRWEAEIYELFYPEDKHFTKIMSLQRNLHCVGRTKDGKATWRMKHNRASGLPNTALGNTLLMCAQLFSYCEDNFTIYEVADDGDDAVLFIERAEFNKLSKLSQYYQEAGMLLKIEKYVDVFEHIDFCQCRPVRDIDGGYTMVRDPRKSIAKDSIAIKPLDNAKVKEMWLAAVGEGGLSLTAGMPVLQEFYSMFKRNSNGAKPLNDPTIGESGLYRLSRGMSREVQEPTVETRVSFWKAFNITPNEQHELEAYYRQYVMEEGRPDLRFTSLPINKSS